MNTEFYLADFERQIAAAASTASLWDRHPFANDMLSAFSAAHRYRQQKQEGLTDMQPTGSDTKIIMAGVASCVLAHQVLINNFKHPDAPYAQVLVKSAQEVLRYWGLEIKLSDPPETSPDSSSEEELIWPPVTTLGRPLHTTLPDVYRENFYHAREQTTGTFASPATADAALVSPEHPLLLRDAYWNEEALQWRLRFSSPLHETEFWLDHCKVRVGDEIPRKAP